MRQIGDYWDRKQPMAQKRGPTGSKDGMMTFAIDGPDGKFKGFIKAKDIKEAKHAVREYWPSHRVCSKVGFKA